MLFRCVMFGYRNINVSICSLIYVDLCEPTYLVHIYFVLTMYSV